MDGSRLAAGWALGGGYEGYADMLASPVGELYLLLEIVRVRCFRCSVKRWRRWLYAREIRHIPGAKARVFGSPELPGLKPWLRSKSNVFRGKGGGAIKGGGASEGGSASKSNGMIKGGGVT